MIWKSYSILAKKKKPKTLVLLVPIFYTEYSKTSASVFAGNELFGEMLSQLLGLIPYLPGQVTAVHQFHL